MTGKAERLIQDQLDNITHSIETTHPTTNDWAPSFDKPEDGLGGFVKCKVNYDQLSVSFWGNDDTYMMRYFDNEDDVRRFACHLPCIICVDYLHSMGFKFNL